MKSLIFNHSTGLFLLDGKVLGNNIEVTFGSHLGSRKSFVRFGKELVMMHTFELVIQGKYVKFKTANLKIARILGYKNPGDKIILHTKTHHSVEIGD